MPLFCTVRPNRSRRRVYTERDAARVMCYAVRAGGSRSKIEVEFEAFCNEKEPERQKLAAEAALEFAVANLDANDNLLRDAYQLFNVINGIIGVLFAAIPLLRLPRFITSLIARGSNLPTGLIPAMTQNIQGQRAANQIAFTLLRNAAANEARFRITGTR